MYIQNSKTSENSSDVIFEFYCIDKSNLFEIDENHPNDFSKKKLDFESLWALIMQIVVIFEDMILTLPSNNLF